MTRRCKQLATVLSLPFRRSNRTPQRGRSRLLSTLFGAGIAPTRLLPTGLLSKRLLSARLLRWPALAMAAALLSACNILPETPQLSYYELPAKQLQPLSSTPADYTLQLLTPYANRTLNTQRILVNPEGYELRAYQGAAWIDIAPAVLRDRLAQALLDTNLVRAMTFSGEAGAPNLVLQIHLYRFQIHYDDGQPVAHLQLNAQLIGRQSGKILAVQPIYVKEPVITGVELEQVIPAFGRAADQVSQELTQWLYQSLHDPSITDKVH